MRSVSTILYIGAVITFIGWLLYRLRVLKKGDPGGHDAQVWREPPAGSATPANEHDQADQDHRRRPRC